MFKFTIRELVLLTVIGAIALVVLASSSLAEEPKWGDLKLRFVYDGQPPEVKLLPVRAGVAFAPVDEMWTVDETSKGVANVVVYLDYQRDETLVVHPELKEPKDRQITVSVSRHRFDPHVTIIRTDQSLLVTNVDPIGHNVKGDFSQNASFNILLARGEKTELTFPRPETAPRFLSDSIHPEMVGYLLICNHPYFAKSDENGQVVIRKLAVGKLTFRVWHEGVGLVKSPVQVGKALEWKRGIFEVDIKEGENDLGKFAIKQRAQ
jgi:hypothetical protein